MRRELLNIFFAIAILFGLISLTQVLNVAQLFCLEQQPLHEAMYYKKLDEKVVQCFLCPRKCVIPDKKRGFCGVRENQGGTLYTLVWSKPVAVHVDPIEKKPFFHVCPGSRSFSIATVGCNLGCKFCQNWQISRARPEDVQPDIILPERIVSMAKEKDCKTIAYTYTEPTIFYEYMFDTAKIAKKAGVKNVMHSAGYINEEPLRNLCKVLDAADIDLKGFTKDYYQKVCFGDLDITLRTLKILKQEGVWVEITNLIVPTLNDNPEDIRKMCQWIKDNLGDGVPIHFSRFWPMYELQNLSPTPVETLEMAKKIAEEVGLKYAYVGNMPGHKGETTYCPRCKKPILERLGYTVLSNKIVDGKCKYCGEVIEGIWQ